MFRFVLTLLTVAALPDTAAGACGERGGPGYRGPTGKCVGWAELGRVCGSPPTSRCSAEAVAGPDADKAAELGDAVQKLRPRSPDKASR